jgi:hypothetical protein
MEAVLIILLVFLLGGGAHPLSLELGFRRGPYLSSLYRRPTPSVPVSYVSPDEMLSSFTICLKRSQREESV